MYKFFLVNQLELIRNLKEQIKNDGAGNNYLIQHTTGSGKSYSIGWLSHLLTSFRINQKMIREEFLTNNCCNR